MGFRGQIGIGQSVGGTGEEHGDTRESRLMRWGARSSWGLGESGWPGSGGSGGGDGHMSTAHGIVPPGQGEWARGQEPQDPQEGLESGEDSWRKQITKEGRVGLDGRADHEGRPRRPGWKTLGSTGDTCSAGKAWRPMLE